MYQCHSIIIAVFYELFYIIKEALYSDHRSRIYAQRKIEVEPVFGQMKQNFGMLSHFRGRNVIHNDLGLLFLVITLQRLMKYILTNMNQRWFIPLRFTNLTRQCHLNSFFLQYSIEKYVLILIFTKSGRAFFYFWNFLPQLFS